MFLELTFSRETEKTKKTKKMPNILFFVDTSTSTSDYLTEYTACVNGLIRHCKTTRPEDLLTLVTFNDVLDYAYMAKKAKETEDIVITPSGTTALHASLCACLGTMLKFNKVTYQSPCLAIILTDGMDTNSGMVTARHSALQIARCKAQGWRFIFLGMTEDAVKLGRWMGANICILYSATTKSFQAIDEVLAGFVTHMDKAWKDVDIDLRILEESMGEMKI